MALQIIDKRWSLPTGFLAHGMDLPEAIDARRKVLDKNKMKS